MLDFRWDGIVTCESHRDLEASSLLVGRSKERNTFEVFYDTNFECSTTREYGARFWKALEVLQALVY